MDSAALKALLLSLLKQHGMALLGDLSAQLLFPEIELLVKNSATPIDDVVLAALEPLLKTAVQNALTKLAAPAV